MSYTETKTLGVKYTDHHFRLYINGSVYSRNEVTLKDGTKVYVESVEEEKVKDIDVNVKVNTTPFDNSVDRCGNHVGTLTGSIIGFKTANVASKVNNEKQIVNSVTSGFSSLIEQNLTLQNAGIEAEMHALAGELMQQCKELEYKHEVMNKDFNRIKSRYTSLFETITKEMNNRIKQIIKPCFDFVSQVRQEQNRRIETSLLSVATTTGKESDSARIAIQASKMKSNAENLISTAGGYIKGNKSLSIAKDKFCIDTEESNKVCYAPVIVVFSGDESSSLKTTIYANPFIDGNKEAKDSLLNSANSLKEREVSIDDKNRIGAYYNKMLSDVSDGSARSQRIVAIMKGFFENNSFKTFMK